MNPKIDRAETEEVGLQERFAEQIEDESLPAAQVLIEQRESHTDDSASPLFVP